jgi:hypothetical protein
VIATPPVYPWPIGVGPRYQPVAANRTVLAGRPVGTMRCGSGRTAAVHVELFANRKVIIVPRGIGVAHRGCTYPVSTDTPTGVAHVRGRRTLGDLFRIWGRRLGPARLLTFAGRVAVFVDGKRYHGEPQRVPLAKHSEIVVEVGGYLPPHRSYLFPKGVG